VYRWRELVVGLGTEQENLLLRYVRLIGAVGTVVAKREKPRWPKAMAVRVPMRSAEADPLVVALKAL